MSNSIIKFFHKNWSLLLVVAIGLLPIFFFKQGLLLSASEGMTDLDIKHYFKYYDLYSWREQWNLGRADIWIPRLFILDFFFYVFSLIGFSLRTVEIFWFIFLWVSAGLAMYFLVKTITDNHEYKLWGFFAALLYLFNTFTMVKVLDENFRLVQIGLPLMLAFFIRGLREERATTKYALLMGLSSLIFASASVNPPAVSIIWITLFFYFCFDALVNKKLSANKIFFVFKILLSYLLLNSWWMIATIPIMISSSGSLKQVMTFTALDTKLFEAFRFLGGWAFKVAYQGVYYFPYHPFYYSRGIIVTFLSFLIPGLAFSCLVFKKINKHIVFFAGLALAGIFLVKGTVEPFGQVYKFIWENVPGFWTFREPFTKFTPLVVFSCSVLFGYTISEFSKKISIHFRDRKKGLIFNFLFSFCMVSVICITVFPIFTGQIFRKESIRAFKSQYIKFPQYWLDAGDWFEGHDRVNKILVLPKSGYGAPYDWEHGISTAGPVTSLLIPNPTLVYRGPSSESERLVNDLYGYFQPYSEEKLVNYLNLFGTKYILQQNDLSWDNALLDTYSPEVMKGILENQEGIELLKQFGELDVYKLQDDYFLPYFYVPQNIIFANNNSQVLFDRASFDDWEIRSGIYINGEGENEGENGDLLSRSDEIFIKANLEESVSREGLGKAIPDLESAFFPYVRWKPGSLIYPLVLKKEQLDEWMVRKNPGKLIEKKLFYAGKRISEIEKWGREMDLDKTFERYKKKMEEAIWLLKETDWENEKIQQENVLKFQTNLDAHWQKIEDLKFSEKELERGLKIFADLNKEIGYSKKKYDLSKLVYDFEIPEDGSYQLFIKNERFNRYFKKDELKLEFLGEERIIPLLPENEKWISGGSFKLEKGEQELKLDRPQAINLLSADEWQSNLENSSFVKNELITPTQLQLAYPEGSIVYFKLIDNYQGDTFYKISFDYFTLGGEAGIVLVEDIGIKRKELRIWEKLSVTRSDSSKYFEKVFKSSPSAKEAEFYFWGEIKRNEDLKIKFFNVKIERVFEPTIILRSTNHQPPTTNHQLLRITFIKINPTKYKIKVEGAKEPYTLVFSESFHQGWKAYISDQGSVISNQYGEIVASYFDGEIKEGSHKKIFLDRNTFETWGKKPISEEQHLLVNGYANSWYITPEDSEGREDYEIIIEFWPQRLFFLGLAISGLTLIGCLGYLGYGLMKKTKR